VRGAGQYRLYESVRDARDELERVALRALAPA
jgi:hypothetical protein